MRIGVYDSGLGGVYILHALQEALPAYDMVFYGDTALLPLGDKTEHVIAEATTRGVRTLFEHDCILVIVACNTASVAAVRKIQDTLVAKEYPDRRVLGVVIPTVEEVIDAGARHVLLIATKRTIESAKYEYELKKRDPSIMYTGVATPELVPLIEAGNIDAAVEKAYAVISTQCAIQAFDTILLGCTHYGVLRDALREKIGPIPRIVAQNDIIPAKLVAYLARHTEIESKLSRNGTEGYIYTQKSGILKS